MDEQGLVPGRLGPVGTSGASRARTRVRDQEHWHNRDQLECLDALRTSANVMKATLLMPRGTNTSFLYLPTDHARLGT